jgi:hypothetical protein
VGEPCWDVTARTVLYFLADSLFFAAGIGQEQIISASAGPLFDKSLAIKKSLWNNPFCFTHQTGKLLVS